MTFPARPTRKLLAVLSLGLALSMGLVDAAEARRGGSFGSRGSRTHSESAATPTAPRGAQPIQRSETPRTGQQAPGPQGAANAQPRPSFMGGLGGSLLKGLAIGGLFGMLLGHGFGGLAGLLGFAFQALLVMGAIMLLMRFLANRRQATPAAAGMPAGRMQGLGFEPPARDAATAFGSGSGPAAAAAAPVATAPLVIEKSDLDTFERLLGEIQTAFGRGDRGALATRTTPEIMGEFMRELDDNERQGLVNEVSDVKLLQGDVSESWREGDADYATVAMRYESRDMMRDRRSGAIRSGSSDLTQTTELWTFQRSRSTPWQLSAIQDA